MKPGNTADAEAWSSRGWHTLPSGSPTSDALISAWVAWSHAGLDVSPLVAPILHTLDVAMGVPAPVGLDLATSFPVVDPRSVVCTAP